MNIEALEEYRTERVLKKVPILTDQVMVDILYIAPSTKGLSIQDIVSDWIYYVVRGAGRLDAGSDSVPLRSGMLMLVPKGERHVFSTDSERMCVLSFRSVGAPKCEIETQPYEKEGNEDGK